MSYATASRINLNRNGKLMVHARINNDDRSYRTFEICESRETDIEKIELFLECLYDIIHPTYKCVGNIGLLLRKYESEGKRLKEIEPSQILKDIQEKVYKNS